MIPNIFEGEPTFTNEAGVKWWIDKHTSQYGIRKGVKGVLCYGVESPDKSRTYVLTNKDGVIFDSTSLEAIAVHLDILALAEGDGS